MKGSFQKNSFEAEYKSHIHKMKYYCQMNQGRYYQKIPDQKTGNSLQPQCQQNLSDQKNYICFQGDTGQSY